ncbi:hypothetical protein [Curvibacter lanceolatus]|uniref:hypothetical protein n=1 Tax=Curvibacter lanceolatus TaxID=86182 RepID=UPI00036B91C2|nr:hypothetical protein [Curvibacter lanceolatus]
MKFKSSTGQDIHIALTSGHTHLIPGDSDEGVDVPPIFVKEALARGAVPADVETAEPNPGKTESRSDLIKAAIEAMLDGSDESNFTSDGKPSLVKLRQRVGFQVAREEADAIFEQVTSAKPE